MFSFRKKPLYKPGHQIDSHYQHGQEQVHYPHTSKHQFNSTFDLFGHCLSLLLVSISTRCIIAKTSKLNKLKMLGKRNKILTFLPVNKNQT